MKLTPKIRYSMSIILMCLMTLLVYLFHHVTDLTAGGIQDGVTQIINVDTKKGTMIYIFFIIFGALSTGLAAPTKGWFISRIINTVLGLIRVYMAMSLITKGASIYVFDGMIGKTLQLFAIFLMLINPYLTIPYGSTKRKTIKTDNE